MDQRQSSSQPTETWRLQKIWKFGWIQVFSQPWGEKSTTSPGKKVTNSTCLGENGIDIWVGCGSPDPIRWMGYSLRHHSGLPTVLPPRDDATAVTQLIVFLLSKGQSSAFFSSLTEIPASSRCPVFLLDTRCSTVQIPAPTYQLPVSSYLLLLYVSWRRSDGLVQTCQICASPPH